MDRFVWTDLIDVIRKRGYLIISCMLISALAGFLVSSYVIAPVYQADASVIVNTVTDPKKALTTDLLDTAEELGYVYGVIIQSDTVLENVIEELNLPMTYEELLSDVTVESVNSTTIMKISVKNQNPDQAVAILSCILEIAPDLIKESVAAGSVKIISKARLLNDPVYPNKRNITLICGLLGILLILFAILVKELLRNTVSSKQEVEKRIGLSVLGEIPLISKKGKNVLRREDTLVQNNSDYFLVECYRSLETNLRYITNSNDYKTVLISSSVPGEGKTNVSLNLALMIASNGRTVLLIECDLRNPSFSRYYRQIHQRKESGLISLLAGSKSFEEAVYQINGVSVLAAGGIAENPVALLNSIRMKKLIQASKENYDYIILDTPPSAKLADSVVLGELADCALIVIAADSTGIQDVLLTKENIEKSNVKIVGSVLNKINFDDEGKYGYYYYGYGSKNE